MADDAAARYREGYRLGLRDAGTGALTCICGGQEAAQMAAGYWAGQQAGRELSRHQLEREAELEAGL
jgi:hypothetical protein